jgi:Fe-S cluster biogenesis protein NfuA
MSKQKEVEEQIASIHEIVQALEGSSDPVLRAKAKDLVQALMALHGACLERMLEVVGNSGAASKSIIDTFGRDELVRSVLLLYGLHPVDMKTRVLQALEKTGHALRLHGGTVELLGIDDAGLVTIKMAGGGGSCASSSASAKQAVEQAIYEAAPDIAGIVVEGYVEKENLTAGFVPLASLAASGQPALQEMQESS